jgi:hypothetical protein
MLVYLTGPVISDSFLNPKKRLLQAGFSGGWELGQGVNPVR